MKTEDKCVMCGDEGMLKELNSGKVFKKLFLAKETNELLCQKCFLNNEELKRGRN